MNWMLEPHSEEELTELRAANPGDWQRLAPEFEDVTWESGEKERQIAIGALDQLFMEADPEAFHRRFGR